MSTQLQGAAAQHAALGLGPDVAGVTTTHPGAQWFPAAGLGLFIHWGIAAVHGNVDLSWGMMANTPWDASAANSNKLTPSAYWELARQFRPAPGVIEKWIRGAAAAGFQYAVFTAMHHDGYTLWPSQWSDLGVHTHHSGTDLVAPFVAACRKYGLKVGLYYSPPDWLFDREYISFNYPTHNKPFKPGLQYFNQHHEPGPLHPRPSEHDAQRRLLWRGRVEELLTHYGHIDLLWMDGGDFDDTVRDRALELQPHLVINNRSCNGHYGSTECHLPDGPVQGWFETCHCWQASPITGASGNPADFWGYMATRQYKPLTWMLESLVQLRAQGANFLVNVSPGPEGELPPALYGQWEELGQWMRHSGLSVVGARPGALPGQANVPVTRNAGSSFLHFLPGFAGPAYFTCPQAPKAVTLLRTGQALEHFWRDNQLTVSIPSSWRTALVDVVQVR